MKPTIIFPDPNSADDDGMLAIGGELSPEFILSAYIQGIFPWFNPGDPILWWSPNPRLVLFPGNFKISGSLKQLIRSGKFTIKTDTCFEDVIENCSMAPRHGQNGTWITEEMKKAYIGLYHLGFAHSFETFQNENLVGGLYGLSIGKAFFGESMFYKSSDASKFALFHLVEFCKKNNFEFIDAQQPTKHLKSLGAIEMERPEFLKMLKNSLKHKSQTGKWTL
ncbi:MAG: leucyl/phenylalanyl-tRNA--protein transferase [Bacteroidales bacterium]|nr:leucyl/phenylalanyl-tRNA--protein transferase [Bacteroidales bacterium]